MKKSLIALAVMAASGASFAQSSVSVYGLADIWFGSVKVDLPNGSSTTTTKLDSGGVNTSRWGLKGSEDLGGGLKANFKLEQAIALDTGAASGFSRYAYVGFSGGFGEVKLGKTGTAYDEVNGSANAVFNSALSAENFVWTNGTLGGHRGSNDYNWNPANTILYLSPEMSGFSGAFSYSLGENKTATVDAGNITSFNLKYAAGPILAAFAYQSEKATGNADEEKFMQLNGSYSLGVAKVLAAYGKVTKNNTADVNEFQIGVDYSVSPALTLSANFASSTSDSYKGAPEEKRSGFGIAAAYSLSKRTFVYGGYNGATNDNGGGGDTKVGLLAVGVQHNF
ncbi:MAG: porin [Rhodoferax sp.]